MLKMLVNVAVTSCSMFAKTFETGVRCGVKQTRVELIFVRACLLTQGSNLSHTASPAAFP